MRYYCVVCVLCMLAEVWCVARNLQLDGSPWGWCKWTPKRFGAVNGMWFNIHSVVHKVWLINGDLHMMHDAYNIKNICCVFRKVKTDNNCRRRVSHCHVFQLQTLTVSCDSRPCSQHWIAIRFKYFPNCWHKCYVHCGRICWTGMHSIRLPQCQYFCKKRRERRSRYQSDWIPYTELGTTAPDIITPSPCAFRFGFPLPQVWIVNLYHKRNTSYGRLYIKITFSITCPDRLWSPPILLFCN